MKIQTFPLDIKLYDLFYVIIKFILISGAEMK